MWCASVPPCKDGGTLATIFNTTLRYQALSSLFT